MPATFPRFVRPRSSTSSATFPERLRRRSGRSRSRRPAQAHVFHLPGVDAAPRRMARRPPTSLHRVDNPHDDAADQQRPAHDVEVLQMLADHLGQQKRRNGGHDECDSEAQRMREGRPVAALAAGKVERNSAMRRAEIHRQAEDRAQLDHDGIHLPVAVDRLMCSSASESRRCAVELTGRNSVRPSTIPKISDSK